MNQFWRSLPGWCSMYKEPPNNTSDDSFLIPVGRTLLPLVKIQVKSKNYHKYFYLPYFTKFKGLSWRGWLWQQVQMGSTQLKLLEGLVGLSPNTTYDFLAPKIARYAKNLKVSSTAV